MDAYLYVVALAVFGILYLVLGVFLVFALLISLLVIYVFLVLRYGQLPGDYPFTVADSLITAIFIGVTWAIFTALGPKNPLPIVGNGLLYSSTSVLPIDAVILIGVVLIFSFLVIGSFVVPRLTGRGRSGGGGQGQQTVGSG
jgi:hypothetical protein